MPVAAAAYGHHVRQLLPRRTAARLRSEARALEPDRPNASPGSVSAPCVTLGKPLSLAEFISHLFGGLVVVLFSRVLGTVQGITARKTLRTLQCLAHSELSPQ